jgi:hypothetical protein
MIKNLSINKYLINLVDNYNLEYKKNFSDKVSKHLKEVDTFPKIAINIYFFLFNIFFFFSSLKFFNKVKNVKKYKKKILIINKLLFYSKIIDELLISIYLLHYLNDEKITLIKKKNKRRIKNNYYENIVIGSGPSGSITALELIKSRKNVLLIEEGNNYKLPKSKHPGEEFIYKWRNGGVGATFPSLINYSSGKCYGGGSEINSGLLHEPDKNFIHAWKKKFSTKNLNIKDSKNLINTIKRNLNLKNYKSKLTQNEKYFINICKNNGLKYQKVPRLLEIKKNRKLSMSQTYLKYYAKNYGDILLGHKLIRIKFIKKEWFLILINKKNNHKKFLKCKNLFLCCGSIYTNKILIKSKILDKNEDSIVKKVNFHPMIKLIVKFKNNVQDLNNDIHSYQINQFYPNYIIGNASSSLQFMLMSNLNNMKNFNFLKENYKKCAVFHITFSAGAGRIVNIPFTDEIIIKYNLNSFENEILKKSIIDTVKIIFNSDDVEKIIIIGKENITLENFSELKNYNLTNFKPKLSSVHVMGGVTMGENNNCIADSYGKLKYHENLYVNDSSLINNKLLKNPQGTVMMLALRNVKKFLEERSNEKFN